MRIVKLSQSKYINISNQEALNVFESAIKSGTLIFKANDKKWHMDGTGVAYTVFDGFRKGGAIYWFKLYILLKIEKETYKEIQAHLYLNSDRTRNTEDDTPVASWNIDIQENASESIEHFLTSNFNLQTTLMLPLEKKNQKIMNNRPVDSGLRLTKNKKKYSNAEAIEIYTYNNLTVNGGGYIVETNTINLETNSNTVSVIGRAANIKQAIEKINELTDQYLASGFVLKNSPMYIPEWASQYTWDFIYNVPKNNAEANQKNQPE